VANLSDSSEEAMRETKAAEQRRTPKRLVSIWSAALFRGFFDFST
jgi:hypothetical protein